MDKEGKEIKPVAGVSAEVENTESSSESESIIKNSTEKDDSVIDDEIVVAFDDDSIWKDDLLFQDMYGGPIPDVFEPVDVCCDMYGGPVDIIWVDDPTVDKEPMMLDELILDDIESISDDIEPMDTDYFLFESPEDDIEPKKES